MIVRSDSLATVKITLGEAVLRCFLAAFPKIEEARCPRCGRVFAYRKHNPPRPTYCVGCVRTKK